MCFELERLPDTPENWNSWCLVQYRNPAENSIFPDRSTGIDINRPAAEAMPVARRMIAENLRRLADEIENATDEIVGTYR